MAAASGKNAAAVRVICGALEVVLLKPNIDILVLTALTEEQQVVHSVLSQLGTYLQDYGQVPNRVATYDFRAADGLNYLIATACMHDMGGVAMGAFATALFNKGIRPSVAVLVGIAATIKRDDVGLSDVPVASEVFAADDIRVDENGRWTPRTHGYPVDESMKAAAGAVREKGDRHVRWRTQCREVIARVISDINGTGLRRVPIVLPSDVELPHLLLEAGAGGPFLIANEEFGTALRAGSAQLDPVHPKLAWVEMEAHGFMKAAKREEIPAIVIKGISDAGDAEKKELEKETGGFFRAYACSNSVVALIHLIEQKPRPPIPPSDRIVRGGQSTKRISPYEVARARRASLMMDPTNHRLLTAAVAAMVDERRLVRPTELWGERNENEARVAELCNAGLLAMWNGGELLQPQLEGLAYASKDAIDQVLRWASATLEGLVAADIARPDETWTTLEISTRCDLSESQVGIALLFLRFAINGCNLFDVDADGRPRAVKLSRAVRTAPTPELGERIQRERPPEGLRAEDAQTSRATASEACGREIAEGVDRPYASRLEDFFREYATAPFRGRDQEIAALTGWLEDVAAPTGFVLAEGGQGKSALLVQWLVRVIGTGTVDILYMPISLRFDTAHVAAVARAISSRLRLLTSLTNASMRADDPFLALDESKEQLREDWPGSRKLLVVLDGLDEAIGWKPSDLLPKTPGKNIKVLIAARGSVSSSSEWDEQLGWAKTPVFSVPPLGREAVRELVTSAIHMEARDGDDALFDRFYQLTGGDPLVVQLHVALLADMSEGTPRQRFERVVRDDVTAQEPLKRFFDRWWAEQRKQWGEDSGSYGDAVQVVLNLLCCAKGPLGLTDLRVLSGAEGESIRDALKKLKRLVIEAPGGERYVLGHNRLGDYFARKLEEDDTHERWRQTFLAYGKQRVAELETEPLTDLKVFQRRFGYVLRYYALHLQQDAPASLSSLLCSSWLHGWRALEGEDGLYGGFFEDVLRAESQARSLRQHGELWRALLIKASIASLSSSVPAELMRGLVAAKLWPLSRALTIAERNTQDDERARALAVLAAAADEDQQRKLVDAALALPPWRRSHAVAWMMPHLTGRERDRALGRIVEDGIIFKRNSLVRLDQLAMALPSRLVPQLLSAIVHLPLFDERVRALIDIVPALDALDPEHHERTLRLCAQEVSLVEERAERAHYRALLARAASKYAPEMRGQLVNESWSDFLALDQRDYAALNLLALISDVVGPQDEIYNKVIESMWASVDDRSDPRTDGLAFLGPRLARMGFVSEVLDRAEDHMPNEHSLGMLLASLVPHAGELVDRVLGRLRQFKRRSFALEPLVYQYAHLSEAQKAVYVEDVLSFVAQKTERSDLLGRLASYLQPNDAATSTVLAAVRALDAPDQRALRLIDCMDLVPPDAREALIEELLQGVPEIEHHDLRQRLLTRVAMTLGNNSKLLQRVLDVSRKLDDGGLLASANALLVERLCESRFEDEGITLGKRAADVFASHPAWTARTYVRALKRIRTADHTMSLWSMAAESAENVADPVERSLIKIDLTHEAAVSERDAYAAATTHEVDSLTHPFKRLYASIRLLRELSGEMRRTRMQEITTAMSTGLSAREQFTLLLNLLPLMTPSERDEYKMKIVPVLDRVLRRTADHEAGTDELVTVTDSMFVDDLAEYLDLETTQEELARCPPSAVSSLEALATRLAKLGQPEKAIAAVRRLEDPESRAKALARLLPDVPIDGRDAVVAEAQRDLEASVDKRHASEASSFLIPYLAEPARTARIRSSLQHVLSESHGPRRRETLQRLIEAAITFLAPETLEKVGTELIRRVGNQRREGLVRDLIALVPLSERLGGKDALVKQGNTLLDVAAWFP